MSEELRLDYGKPMSEIYTDTARKLIKISQTLIILSQAYQCEYQQYAINYAGRCRPLSPIPFFPTPSNVANDCSCNLGNVYLAINSTMLRGDACLKATKNQDSRVESKEDAFLMIEEGENCRCCQISESFASQTSIEFNSLDTICPGTSPLNIGYMSIVHMANNLSLAFERCTKYTQEGKCVPELDFPESVHGASTPLSCLAYPQLRLFTQSNTAKVAINAGTVSSPPSAATFTWTDEPYYWTDIGRRRTLTPRYTVTAVTSAPTNVDAGVTRAEASFSASTALPSYTLNLDHLDKGVATNRMANPKLLAIGVIVFIIGCLF
ncbi:hypothetical protein DL98DRAFT_566439 [Cadophora sp. DSE1049]|nr:hypothetical protein DL98DRAFT_566439 [Cadophora sp. DSE1049]